MSRILLVWELGSNYGHISQFLPVARELKRRGHDVALVVRELHQLRGAVADIGFPVLQAPLWLPTVQGLPDPPLNYAEILLRYGYHEATGLAGVVNAWRALLMLYRADLIITSHAPTALLAARTLGLPAAVLGTGFSVPPRAAPTPNMRDWLPVSSERLVSSDAIVLNSINTLLKACGKPRITALSDLFDVKENFLCTLPELDHYAQRADGQYWGAVCDADMGREAAWPAGDDVDMGKPRVFVYLEPMHRDFSAAMAALARLGCRALVCAPGIAENLRQRLETPSLVISGKPFKFSSLLNECDLAIGHTGHGTTFTMLMAGIPMLMFPNHLEQYLLALRVQQLGAGKLVNLEQPPVDIGAWIQEMLDTPSYKARAHEFATRHADFAPAAQLAEIADRIEEIAAT